GTVFFYANDADNTVSGGTITDDVVFTTDVATTWTLERDLTIDGDLTIESGAILDLDTYDLTVTGEVWVNGTLDASGSAELWFGEGITTTSGTYTSGSEKVYFYSAGAITITADDSFGTIMIDKGANTITLGTSLASTGDLTITSGTLDVDTYDLTVGGNLDVDSTLDGGDALADIFVAGDFDSSGGTFTAGSGAIHFTGSTDSTLTLAEYELNDIYVNKTALSDSLTIAGALTVAGDLQVQGGRFWIENNLTMNGNMTVSSGGGFRCSTPGTDIFFANADTIGYWVNAGASIELTGSLGSEVVLRSDVEDSQWDFYANGDNSIDRVDVQDSDASGGNTVTHTIDVDNSINSGNNLNWGFNATPVVSDPLCEGERSGAYVTDATPEFSAIFNDTDAGDTGVAFEIEVDDNSDFLSTVWDTGQDDFTDNAFNDIGDGVRSDDIPYNYDATGVALTIGTRYYWRIRFWDSFGAVSSWSATQIFIYDPQTSLGYLITFDDTTVDDIDVE
ncbi:hypothetical protein ACFL3D_04635, partial [Candidatus Omnitrophota bacterium]